MTIEGMRKNAQEQIDSLMARAEQGKFDDADTVTHLACKRKIYLCDEIVPQITQEEWARIKAGTPGIPRDMSDCKDIKEKYDLSWNELKALKDSDGGV